jgi:hypothetical protein
VGGGCLGAAQNRGVSHRSRGTRPGEARGHAPQATCSKTSKPPLEKTPHRGPPASPSPPSLGPPLLRGPLAMKFTEVPGPGAPLPPTDKFARSASCDPRSLPALKTRAAGERIPLYPGGPQDPLNRLFKTTILQSEFCLSKMAPIPCLSASWPPARSVIDQRSVLLATRQRRRPGLSAGAGVARRFLGEATDSEQSSCPSSPLLMPSQLSPSLIVDPCGVAGDGS